MWKLLNFWLMSTRQAYFNNLVYILFSSAYQWSIMYVFSSVMQILFKVNAETC